jgi:ABC-2 type transport system ATP-binding protein
MPAADEIAIRAQQLARRFVLKKEVVEAVRKVDLEVKSGEIVAFLGPNGAGKTTTLRMLTTLLQPTGGRATVAGYDIRDQPVEVRRHIGHIGQGTGSYQGVLVREEVYTQARFYDLDRATARARTTELLDQLELTEQANRDVARLSGGQRRRLDIAMGLVHRPDVLFLDEPSAGLDPHSRANLWEHISRVRGEHCTTIFLTTHYLDEADSVAERVIVIDHGQIIADGTPDELKATVSGDLLTVELAEGEDAPRAAEVAATIPGAQDVATDGGMVNLRVERGNAVMPELVRAMDTANVGLHSTQVRRPTLDDVFLSMTGRSLREEQAA